MRDLVTEFLLGLVMQTSPSWPDANGTSVLEQVFGRSVTVCIEGKREPLVSVCWKLPTSELP